MSLIQHVTQTEGTDREEALVDLFLPPLERQITAERDAERRFSIESGFRPGSLRSVRRVISYDALKPPEELPIDNGGVTQYTVSKRKRIAQVIVTVLVCWFASGIVFGFAALKPILVKEGVFRELCTQEELDADVDVCYEQDLRLNFFFSLASTTANVSALPIGTMLDRYGPKACFLFGSACLALGSLLMSLAFQIPEFDGYTMGNFLIALGGTAVFLPAFQIANAFPKYSGTIVALVTGAFDASAAVFLFYRIAYEATDGHFTPRIFFLVYLLVPVALVIAQLTLLPSEAYKSLSQLEEKIARAEDPTRDVHDSDEELPGEEVWRVRKGRSIQRRKRLQKLDKLVGSPDTRKQKEEKEEQHHEASGVWGALHNKSAAEQMRTPWFILLTLLTVLQMMRMNYFISTIREQYDYMLDSGELGTRVNEFFDWALPLGGALSTPFLGALLDNVSTPIVLLIILIMTTIIGVVSCIPALWAGYINVILFVLLRPLYYSAMSDYATKVFGFATFGRVYGTIVCVSGLFNLCQTAIDALTKRTFHGNPIPVNASLAVAGFIFGAALVLYVSIQVHRLRKKLDEEDAITVTNTEADSVLDSLMEEDEPRGYGSFGP
ncbi:MFS general substrate transporter [Aaosphaeria arxii CBS 175.79]|uniref:MFS general substrate transporter n=1 Tax=Aaosphaeria arxii CBS 175.79 TaxID=1450172 RepID=A0A6A5XDP4_9PLEO|nr:MFS general substrate transporter [Aaosphaeria arxii CBS 175.79]KAF2011000.1 MFS general substrate transporter [Aaosphaeria arxii CBS 175.79]